MFNFQLAPTERGVEIGLDIIYPVMTKTLTLRTTGGDDRLTALSIKVVISRCQIIRRQFVRYRLQT